MATRTPPSHTSLTAARASLPAGDVIDSVEATQLAARFHEARRQALRTLVDMSVEAGQVLVDAQRLMKESYARWLRERLQLEPSTARNYVSMAKLAEESPWAVERYKQLGASKLYQVARLPAESRRTVLHTPGVETLNDRQFVALVRPHVTRRRKVTGNMRAHGLRQKIASFKKELEGARVGRIEDGAMRTALVKDLRELRRAAEELLKRIG